MLAPVVAGTDSSRGRSLAVRIAIGLAVGGMLVRLHNAWASPPLAGYDSFGHFTYVWYVAATGSLPMATHGWSFFHPPLWYAAVAALWNALDPVDPLVRLRVAKVLVAALGAAHPLVAWRMVARRFPGDPVASGAAAVLAAAVPVQLYGAAFLGNEGLHAVLGAASVAALLAVLGRPTAPRALLLGLALGAALLAKYSAVAIGAASLAAIVVQGLRRREPLRGLLLAALAAVAALLLCGPFYARNVAAYGTPFQLSRDEFLVAYVEGNQPQASRGPADYLTFDPLILRRPVWPRGSTPTEDYSPHDFGRSVRESVWTGLYANTWFDGFGGWFLPPVTESELSRRSGQVLLVLALVPTALMLVGLGAALARREDRRHDTTTAALLLTASMLALFVLGTRSVPIAAAVKATYFTPISVVFAYWLACGLVRVGDFAPRARRAAEAACALLAVVSMAVFCQGLLFDTDALGRTMPRFQDAKAVQDGIVAYAGGSRDAARAAFAQAAASNYHLGWENLAFLEIDEGHPRRGLRLLRRAARLQRSQLDGGPRQADRFLRLALAEYDHSMAVVLHEVGGGSRARHLWARALGRDPSHGEALYCGALSRMEEGLAGGESAAERALALEDAALALGNLRELDPGLDEGWNLGAAIEALRGDCDGARRLLAQRDARPCHVQRRFPAETGTGAGLSASIGRRRLIRPSLPWVEPEAALSACGLAP